MERYTVYNKKKTQIDFGYVVYNEHDVGIFKTDCLKNSDYEGKTLNQATFIASEKGHNLTVAPYKFTPKTSKTCVENLENIGGLGLGEIEFVLKYLASEIDKKEKTK